MLVLFTDQRIVGLKTHYERILYTGNQQLNASVNDSLRTSLSDYRITESPGLSHMLYENNKEEEITRIHKCLKTNECPYIDNNLILT